MSLGRTGDALKKGQPAIEELGDAMKKGNVYSAKVLPYVAEIAKQMAEPGLQEARGASFAQQNRFMNQLSQGWKAFSQGGGESGVAFFWQMMQRMGQWWIDNGSALGKAFETSMYWLDAVRLGVYEFTSFMKTGENNSFVEWASSWGVNLEAYRAEISQMFKTLGEIFGVTDGLDLKTRIQNFGIRLQEILREVNVVLEGISRFMNAARVLYDKKWYESYAGLNPFSDYSKQQREAAAGFYQAVGGVFGATKSAAGAMTDQVGITSVDRTDYKVYGNAAGGFTPATDWNRDWKNGMNFPSAIRDNSLNSQSSIPQKSVLSNVAPQSVVFRTPVQNQSIPQNNITTPQMYADNLVKPPTQEVAYKVDLNVKIDGNADIMSMIDKTTFYTKVSEVAGDTIDKRIRGAMTSAPIRK
jgi:hypothetical protein